MSNGKMSPDHLEHTLKNIGNPMTNAGPLRTHIAALEKERDAALADNAALVSIVHEGMYFIRTTHLDMGGNHRYAVNNGPIAAKAIGVLLALKLEDHHGAALLEEHRKALVRARNEGLEMAARAAGPDRGLAARIRAMKEPEQCTDASCAKCRSGEPCH